MDVIEVGRDARTRGSVGRQMQRGSSRVPPELVVGWPLAVAALATGRLWSLHVSSSAARSELETTITISALIGALLLGLRFRGGRRLHDLLLVMMLSTVAVSDFVLNALPAYEAPVAQHGIEARVAIALLITWGFLAIAMTNPDRTVGDRPGILPAVVLAGLLWVAAGDVVGVLGPRLTGLAPSTRPPIAAGVVAFGGLLVAALLLARHRRPAGRDGRMLQFAIVLLATAQMSRVSLPLVPNTWITPTVLVRVAAYGLLLAVAVLRYRASAQERITRAVAEEGRRIARDLHDGLAQDLAFIAAHCDRLADEYGAEHPLTVAARRALAVSRRQIIDLEAADAPSTEAALRAVAGELAARHRISVQVRASGPAPGEPPPGAAGNPRRSDLVRIAREAITNAIRHGGAENIEVALGAAGEPVLLRISDDGCGFAGSAAGSTAGSRTGLNTMSDRARRLGAKLRTGRGECGRTQVEVVSTR